MHAVSHSIRRRATLPLRLGLAAVWLGAGSVLAAPPGGGWAMAWSDEFGGSALDGSKWSIGTGARRDATNTANAITVGGGALTLKTYTEGGKHYTGWLASNGKFENAFGYWEARIRYNDSPGMWSAFWLQPGGINNVGDPAGNGTEIDISEHRRQDTGGGDLRNQSSINVHWDGYGADHKSVGTTVTNPGVDGSSLQGNYHTYGLLWEPGKYTFFLDGSAVWSTTAAISNVRQWIYLTSEVDTGAWAGAIPSGGYGDRAASGTKFEVDWVRFWQRAEQVINPGFANRTGPWVGAGSASWNSTGGRGGGAGVRLNPSTTQDAAFEQNVHGLLPNTDYRVLGWGNVGVRSWPDLRIGVKNHGNAEAFASIWTNGFSQAEVPFVTGAANSSARIYAWVPTQWGDCYADDIEIRRDAQVNNAGFEAGEEWPWQIYGDAFVHNWAAYKRSGAYACRFNGSAAARGAQQTVYGLRPDTAYTISCWVRGGGQPFRLGVKNHGLTESFAVVTASGNTWQRATHTFTTGATATSATVYAFVPDGSNVGALDVDDFLLGQEVPAPWTVADIGAVGRNGEAVSRHGRLVVRGSGADVYAAADAFRFVYQPVAGNFACTARLDSFEADHDRAKAGVMLRASVAADSAHAMVHWLPEGQVEFIWRATPGATSGSVWAATAVAWPPRLRLQRAGDVVTASYSTNGTTWVTVGVPQVIALPSAPLAGPAVCAHDSGNTAVGVFSNLSFSGDRDGDGILDDYETHTGTYVSATDTGTDPDSPDTDGDGFADGAELVSGTDPLVANGELVWQTGATPGGTGTWSAVAPNWRVGSAVTPWLAGKTALFGGAAGTVTVDGSASAAAGLLFNTAGYTLGGSGPLALADGAAVTVNAGPVTLACPLGATPELTVSGGGALYLTGNNAAFAGTVVVDGNSQLRGYNTTAGTGTGTELGGNAATIDLRAGSWLRWFNVQGNPVYPAGFRLNGAGSFGVLNNDSGGTTVRTVNLAGPLTLDSDATIGTQNSGAYVLAGPITGEHTLTFDQAAAASSITGPLAVTRLNKTGAGTLTLASVSLTAATITGTAGTLDFNPAADTTFGGTLAGAGTITKSGPRILTLAGANTFGTAGGTYQFGGGTANAGAIRLAHPQALGAHAKIRLNSGQGGVSRLELAGGHVFPLHVDTVGRNTAAGNVALRNAADHNTLQGNFTLVDLGGAYHVEAAGGSSLTITGGLTTTLNAAAARDVRFTGDGDITLQGALADSATATPTRLSVTKEGAGTLRLTGISTHSQTTQVTGGTLRLDGRFTASPVNVGAAATLAGTGTLPAATVAGRLALAIGQTPLEITGTLALTGATLELSGATTAPVQLLARRAALTGSFAAVTGVPVGYTVDPAYQGTAVALVRKPTADYEIWAAGHALGLATTGAPGADPDADGLANAIEFTLGMDPGRADGNHPGLPRVVPAGQQVTVSFVRLKAAAANGMDSRIEWAPGLDPGSWVAATPGQTTVTDHGATETVMVTLPRPPGPTGLFARLVVTWN